MPLELKLNISTSEDCKQINIIEKSGTYNISTNATGWGGPNISPEGKVLRLIVKSYVPVVVNDIGDKKTIAPLMSVSSDNSMYANFQSDDYNIQSVKIAIPFSDLYLSIYAAIETEWISLGLTTEEKDFVMANMTEWESIQDHVYLIVGQVLSFDGTFLNVSSEDKFNSICNIEKRVNDLLTKIDLRCEDCDDQDIEDVSLYNALLQNLKNA